MADHAECSPSKLERIILCPGSVSLIRHIEKQTEQKLGKPNEYALHGTMLHEIIAHMITDAPGNKEAFNELDLNDQVLITDALDYLNLVKKKLKIGNTVQMVEARVSLKDWGVPEVWGTNDLSLIDYARQHADVIDWKFGSGVYVNAYQNPQEMAYAAGALCWPTPIKTITLHIVQPAIDNYSTYDMTINELYPWVHTVLAPAVHTATTGTPVLNPGEEQCIWCEVMPWCEAHRKWVQDAGAKAFTIYEQMNVDMSMEAIIEFLEEVPPMSKVVSKIHAFLQAELLAGRQVPGMKLVQGKANRKWKNEEAVIKWLDKNSSIDEMFKSNLISPSQAEKLDRRLKKNEDFGKLYMKPQGKLSMVKESDPRPAFQVKGAAPDVFKDFVDNPKESE